MTKQTQSPTINWHHIVVMALAAFAFFMSGLVSERVFERVPHLEDEIAYLYQAKIFAGGQVVVDSPQPTQAYWQPFVLDSRETGNRFGKYTPGWSAILSLGVFFGYEQIINACFAVLTVALVYRLGREIFNPDVGVIAALLVAFSPAALLLNATLMSHTTGLFFATLFIYAYWRLEKHKRPYLWGWVAGFALGILAATRPLTTLGIALPFIIWSGIRLLMALIQRENFLKILLPLLFLSAGTLTLASSIPLFSYAATGDASQNLYELVWDYDRIGFGECCGRNRHRLEKAFAHARFDLSLTAADLFGWQFEPVNDEMIHHLQIESDYYEGKGYSFYLLSLGVLLGLGVFSLQKRNTYLAGLIVWAVVAFAWVRFPIDFNKDFYGMGVLSDILSLDPALMGNITFSWVWIILALSWLFLPLLFWHRNADTPYRAYTWLLLSVVGSVVIVQMLYWIGSQRYSTRYYYEALTAAAILTAIPLATIIRAGVHWLKSDVAGIPASSVWRFACYSLLTALCIFTLYNYSTPRINALYRYNGISPDLIEQVESASVDDRPILAIVNGTRSGDTRVRWRSYGALMAVTSPYLDSEIVAARASSDSEREMLIAQYPDRQVVDVIAIGDQAAVQPPAP